MPFKQLLIWGISAAQHQSSRVGTHNLGMFNPVTLMFYLYAAAMPVQ